MNQEAWEYAVLVIAKVWSPAAPNGPETAAVLISGKEQTLVTRTAGFLAPLNIVGADGWLEYRREFNTGSAWVTPSWMREELGHQVTTVGTSVEFWMRRRAL